MEESQQQTWNHQQQELEFQWGRHGHPFGGEGPKHTGSFVAPKHPFWGSIMKRPYIVNPKRFGPIKIWHILACFFQLDWRYIQILSQTSASEPSKVQIYWPCLIPNIGWFHHQKFRPATIGCIYLKVPWRVDRVVALGASPWWRSEFYAPFPHWPSNQRCEIRELNGGWNSWENHLSSVTI